MNERAPLTIRANIIKVSRVDLLNNLKSKGFDVEKTEHSPYGINFRSHPRVFLNLFFYLKKQSINIRLISSL